MRQRKAGNAAERAFFAPSAIFCRGKEGARTVARPNIAAARDYLFFYHRDVPI